MDLQNEMEFYIMKYIKLTVRHRSMVPAGTGDYQQPGDSSARWAHWMHDQRGVQPRLHCLRARLVRVRVRADWEGLWRAPPRHVHASTFTLHGRHDRWWLWLQVHKQPAVVCEL